MKQVNDKKRQNSQQSIHLYKARTVHILAVHCLLLFTVAFLVFDSFRTKDLDIDNSPTLQAMISREMEDPFEGLNISVENLSTYEKFDILFARQHSSSTIKRVLGDESLNSMCRHLPAVSPFMNTTLKDEGYIDVNDNTFHLVLLYQELKGKHLCVLEGLINMINADPRRHDTKLILWISPDGVYFKKRDRAIFSATLNEAEFDVEFKFLDIVQMFRSTPLEGFYKCMSEFKLDLGKYKNQNIGNAVRLAILQKYGGFYLDWDFLVTGNLLDIDQGIGFQDESHNFLNNAAMRFKSGSKILNEIILEFINDYDGNIWAHNGPRCLKRTFENRTECHSKGPSKTHHYCVVDGITEDIKFHEPSEFYPIPYEQCNPILLPVDELNTSLTEGSSLIHLWNHFLAPKETSRCRHNITEYRLSTVGRLREKYCPSTFEHMVTKANCSF